MRVLVCGAGAVGSVLGGFLALDGHEVVLYGRAEHLNPVREKGLEITGIWGEHRIRALGTASSAEDLANAPDWDWIFVCVKTHQTPSILPLVRSALGARARVCAFQNGIDSAESLSGVVPRGRLCLARVIFGAEREPGRVRVTVSADDVRIGAVEPGRVREDAAALADALRRSGIPASAVGDVGRHLWSKLIYNCALNGLATVLGVPYGALLESAVTRDVMRRIVVEAYRTAEAAGVALEPDSAQAYASLLFEKLIPATAEHHPSMLQDIRRCRPTEVDALNGAVVRRALQAGVAVPMNAMIVRFVREQERQSGIPAAGPA